MTAGEWRARVDGYVARRGRRGGSASSGASTACGRPAWGSAGRWPARSRLRGRDGARRPRVGVDRRRRLGVGLDPGSGARTVAGSSTASGSITSAVVIGRRRPAAPRSRHPARPSPPPRRPEVRTWSPRRNGWVPRWSPDDPVRGRIGRSAARLGVGRGRGLGAVPSPRRQGRSGHRREPGKDARLEKLELGFVDLRPTPKEALDLLVRHHPEPRRVRRVRVRCCVG